LDEKARHFGDLKREEKILFSSLSEFSFQLVRTPPIQALVYRRLRNKNKNNNNNNNKRETSEGIETTNRKHDKREAN